MDIVIKENEPTIVTQQYTLEFKTDDDWQPMTTLCWVGCPFHNLISLGKSCAFIKKESPLFGRCPFVVNLKEDN